MRDDDGRQLVWIWPPRPFRRTRGTMSNSCNGVRTFDEPGAMRNVRIPSSAAKPGYLVSIHHLSARPQMSWTNLEHYCPSEADLAAVRAAMPDLQDVADVPWIRVKSMLASNGHEPEKLGNLEAEILMSMLRTTPPPPDEDATSDTHGQDTEAEGAVSKPDGWTRAELIDQANHDDGEGAKTLSGTTFDRIREAAGIPSAEKGGVGAQRRFSVAQLRQLIDAAEAGTYRNGSNIAAAWRELLPS